MAKAGRKPKAEHERQTEVVALRLTPAEKAELQRGAGGRPLGTWARQLVLGCPVPVIPEVNREAWRKTAGAAANLNQMALKLNMGMKPGIDEARETVQRFRMAILGLAAEWEREQNDSKDKRR